MRQETIQLIFKDRSYSSEWHLPTVTCFQPTLHTAQPFPFFLIFFKRAAAFSTVAFFSERFMFRQPLISSLLRPQPVHTSCLSLQLDTQGLSISLAIEGFLVSSSTSLREGAVR